ncbi:MAG: cupin domain-containing protein [Rhodovibrionaceae bacterium]
MAKSIIRIATGAAGEPEIAAIDPQKVISGEPIATTENVYANAAGNFFSGVWSSSEGKWRIAYAEEEFCVLLSGRVALTDAEGRTETFSAGDAFVIPAGFEGTWETLEPVRKLYAIGEI